MPVLSCGGMRYQFKWDDQPLAKIPQENQRNLEATIQRAFEVGVNHIETARGYGSSERQLGLVLPRLPREQIIVQTKVSPSSDARAFTRDFEDSLRRLQLDYVDMFSLHGVNNEEVLEWAIRPGGCFEAAQRLRDAGKCRFVGLSTHADLPTLLKALRFGEARTGQGFDYVNLHWYFIFQRNWPAILEATRRDMGVFIISPSDKGGRLYAPPPELVELCRPLSPMVFNDLFCLSRPEVHTLSIGAARPSDFDEHLKALPLLAQAKAELAPIEARLAAAMRGAIGEDDPEAIVAGLPRWEDTPQHFNLPVILWLQNLARGWGLKDYAQWRYNMLTNSGHWFPGNKPSSTAEVDRCELSACLRDHPRAQEIPGLLREACENLAGEARKRLSEGG